MPRILISDDCNDMPTVCVLTGSRVNVHRFFQSFTSTEAVIPVPFVGFAALSRTLTVALPFNVEAFRGLRRYRMLRDTLSTLTAIVTAVLIVVGFTFLYEPRSFRGDYTTLYVLGALSLTGLITSTLLFFRFRVQGPKLHFMGGGETVLEIPSQEAADEFKAFYTERAEEGRRERHRKRKQRAVEARVATSDVPVAELLVSRTRGALKFACPSCDTATTVPTTFAGKKGKCPTCKTALRVPAEPRRARAA